MKKTIVAYLTQGSFQTPEASAFSHVNYAFGWVNADQIVIRNPEELQKLAALRDETGFKLLVSLQQNPRTAFCTRSKTAAGREKLAKQCKELVDIYRLDGIDVDWEYPGIDISTGEDNCETCRDDFIELLAAIRREIGAEKLLTFACGATPDTQRHIDFARAAQILDCINIMGYDYNWNLFGKAHHSNLYPSADGIGDHAQCGDRCVHTLLSLGVPREKLVLGIPFYGYINGKGSEGFLHYDQITELLQQPEYALCFDEAARQSYVTRNGEFYIAFDDPRTIAEKADYIKQKDLGGIMYWAYAHDDPDGTLRHAVRDALWGKEA